MHLKNTAARYGLVSQGLHWLTAILVLVAYIASAGGPETRVYSQAFDSARRLHETLGMALFGIVLLRLLWRWADPQPDVPIQMPWMKHAGRITHGLLYILLVSIPLSAIIGSWLEGHPVTLLGADIAPWVASSHALGAKIIEVHTTIGNVILWVAGLHAAAAIFHHWYLRDGILRSMLPWRS
jgi:cytochrome b561